MNYHLHLLLAVGFCFDGGGQGTGILDGDILDFNPVAK